MSPAGHHVDELLEAASEGMDRAVRRMRDLLPKDDGDWEPEEAFGVDDPAKLEAELRAEEEAAASEPVVDRPRRRGMPSWRELFRKNWPDKPRGRR